MFFSFEKGEKEINYAGVERNLWVTFEVYHLRHYACVNIFCSLKVC